MPKITVQSQVRELPFVAPFSALLRLREVWGEREVALLESMVGAEPDAAASLIGFAPVFSIAVTRTRVRLSGQRPVLAAVTESILRTGVVKPSGDAFEMSQESDLWTVLRAISATFDCPENPQAEFRFGFFGYLGYDVVRSVERLPYEIPATDDTPTTALTLYRGVLTFDQVQQKIVLRTSCAPGTWDAVSLDETTALVLAAGNDPEVSDRVSIPPIPKPDSVTDSITQEEYLKHVATALHHISIGDIYQVQLGHEIRVRTSATPLSVYRRLRVRNPSPYMYLLPFEGVTLVGASPECFLRLEKGRIVMRPIAGTSPRGRTPEEDAELVYKLQHDEKELAEHIMLVDLCRNDIGRVCRAGTLVTDELLVVEQYSHVNHLVSNVTGMLRDDVDSLDAIAATFPAGTMTGAPKIRAMEIIEHLETSRRGPYAGAVGLMDFSGYTNVALCIRSATHRNGEYLVRASAGVVADSVPEKEWKESLHKMGATYWAVTGEELQS